MLSGCEDAQTSADVSDVANFSLPDPAGRGGGACTSALLQVLYADHKDTAEDLSFEEVLLKIRDNIDEMGLSQVSFHNFTYLWNITIQLGEGIFSLHFLTDLSFGPLNNLNTLFIYIYIL